MSPALPASPSNPPRLLAVATAVPPHPLDQDAVVERIKSLFERSRDLDRLLPVFANSGIRRRFSCVPIEWYDTQHGWAERNRLYLASALDLIDSATRTALRRAGRGPDEIGAVVAVSSTGIATPSLDALLIDRLELRPEVRRLPLFGLGCAGGVIGLARAAAEARLCPGETVLLVVVELCALSFRRDDDSKRNLVATALFGDGGAAALLSTDGPGPSVTAAGEHTWPDTLAVMGWEVADDGLRTVMSRDIPHLVLTRLAAAASAFLARHGLTLDNIDRFVCHPGGAKVLSALERAFALPPAALADGRAVLRDYGNMSAATVMFLLEHLLAEPCDGGRRWRRALVNALGPGFTAAFLTLENG
jgi:alkylresorcinol/alkylpyrone synthase